MRLSIRWVACFGLVIVTGGLVALSAAAERDAWHGRCSLATLNGVYVYAADGRNAEGEEFTEAGIEIYHGDGTMEGSDTRSTEGVISRDVYTGTYTVNPDCTGTLTTSLGGNYDQFILPSGEAFTWISTDPGVIWSSFEKRSERVRH
ncbi:hypothetical protein [Sorangium sp. So ce542]|uniref:hypothetical protein n=1 Tax=Sorangium sp. So ce542 TaxID=3133316 RepID=UPI003F60F204